MGKKKKVTEKVKLFYRGPLRKPNKVADDDEMQTISTALKDCLSKRNCAFQVNWRGKKVPLKLVIGLSASLRSLKHNRTQALIYDETAGSHLAKYFNEFAYKANIPIIQASKLVTLAPELKLKTLLVISVVDLPSGEEDIYHKQGNPKPNPIKEFIISEPFNKLCQLLESLIKYSKANCDITFKQPVLDKVPSTGKSKAKKELRKATKAIAKKVG